MSRVRHRHRAALTLALATAAALTAVAVPAVPAAASGPTVISIADNVANSVEPDFWSTVAPTQYPSVDDTETPEVNDITFETTTTPVTLSAPSPSGMVPINVNGTTANLLVPRAANLNYSTSNTSVYEASTYSTVVERNQNRLRTMMVLNSGSAPDFTFTFGGGNLRFARTADGVITVQDNNGQIVGAVNDPWAKDANGVSLPTSYTIVGAGDLKQHINLTGAAYPVVADPTISFGWYVYVRYSKSEIHWAYPKLSGYTTPAQGLGVVLCAILPIGWVAAACSFIVVKQANSIYGTLKYAYDNNRCMEIRMTYYGPVVGWRTYSC
jgi:hypothetical protein